MTPRQIWLKGQPLWYTPPSCSALPSVWFTTKCSVFRREPVVKPAKLRATQKREWACFDIFYSGFLNPYHKSYPLSAPYNNCHLIPLNFTTSEVVFCLHLLSSPLWSRISLIPTCILAFHVVLSTLQPEWSFKNAESYCISASLWLFTGTVLFMGDPGLSGFPVFIMASLVALSLFHFHPEICTAQCLL